MNDSTVATVETQVATEPKAKKVKAKASKPAANKAKAQPSENGDKLGKAHVRILKALKQAGKPITRTRINEICAKTYDTAKKFSAWMTEPLGQADEDARRAWEKKTGKQSLISRKLVKQTELDIDGKSETVYELTAAGRKALEKAS